MRQDIRLRKVAAACYRNRPKAATFSFSANVSPDVSII